MSELAKQLRQVHRVIRGEEHPRTVAHALPVTFLVDAVPAIADLVEAAEGDHRGRGGCPLMGDPCSVCDAIRALAQAMKGVK